MATAKIKTFEDACKKLGITPTAIPETRTLPKQHIKAILAHYKLVIIAEALNDGWKPDWKNSSQYKYYPWFNLSSGSGLSYDGYDNRFSYSHVGSRLCFKSSELAEYAGKQFKKLYQEYFLIS